MRSSSWASYRRRQRSKREHASSRGGRRPARLCAGIQPLRPGEFRILAGRAHPLALPSAELLG
eukprot:13784734-Alexandrium_andersonii.AAC.1